MQSRVFIKADKNPLDSFVLETLYGFFILSINTLSSNLH